VLPRRDGDLPGTVVTQDGVEIGHITSVGSTQVLAYVKRGHEATTRD
jgi:hypothetical protein